MKTRSKKRAEKRQNVSANPEKQHLQKYANLYVKKRSELIPMMEAVTGESIPKDATHGELIKLYIHLLKTNPAFAAEVNGMINGFNEAIDPVTAIAEAAGNIANIFDGDVRTAKVQAEAQSDAALYNLILNSQEKDNTSTILIVSGISLLAVGAIIYFIVKK